MQKLLDNGDRCPEHPNSSQDYFYPPRSLRQTPNRSHLDGENYKSKVLSKSCSYCRLRGQDRRYLNGENENLESHCLAKVALTSFLNNQTPDFLDGVNFHE